MQVSSPAGLFEPQEFDLHDSGRALDAPQALLCLTRDEAQFLDAAFERILPGDGSGAARYVDRKLWEAALPGGPLDRGALRCDVRPIYRAGIAAVQAYCVRVYARRFQALRIDQQRAVLSLLEDGTGFGGIAQFQVLSGMLVNDAAEACFDGHRPSPDRSRSPRDRR
jgi:Gluconate 2-dehydrogenase subunit 3